MNYPLHNPYPASILETVLDRVLTQDSWSQFPVALDIP